VSSEFDDHLTILLVSTDHALAELCRGILRHLGAGTVTLVVADEPSGTEADVVLYDVAGSSDVVRFNHVIRHHDILLIDRDCLWILDDSHFKNLPFLVLKPITERSVRFALEQAIDRGRIPEGDSRTLLQLTLEAVLKVQQYDQDRTNFLARGIHDFRAPLTAIKGYCGLLIDQQLGDVPPQQVEILRRMQHSINRLSRMADGMLQLSVRDRRPTKLEFREADLSACIDQASSELGPSLREKHIELVTDMQQAPDVLTFDPSRIEQVVVNLLDNACKFTPRNGSIGIRGYPFFWERRHPGTSGSSVMERRHVSFQTPNAYRVDIRDSGPPIPIQQLSNIFEEYTSLLGGGDRSGVGLGLAICKLIISQHNGHIWAATDHDQTVFSFVLPSHPQRDRDGGNDRHVGTMKSANSGAVRGQAEQSCEFGKG
jgi:signal transduction histidine kinase